MDARVILIRVNRSGALSVFGHDTIDPLKLGLPSFSCSGIPARARVLAEIPHGLVTKVDRDYPVVERILHPSQGISFISVVGDHNAFASSNDEGQWYDQTKFKFGPLPQGATKASNLPDLYLDAAGRGALDRDDVVAVLSGICSTRAKRLGVAVTNDVAANLFQIASDPRRMAQVVDSKIDMELPLLGASDSERKTKLPIWGKVTQQISEFAAAIAQERSPRPASGRGAAATARVTARAAQRTRETGEVPKPV